MAKIQTKTFNGVTPLVLPVNAGGKWVSVPIDHPATAPAANDIYEVCELPIGVRVLDWTIQPADIDSNATPTLAASLGTMNAGFTDLGTEVWGTALAIGQSNATVRAATSASALGDTTVVRRVGLKVTTASATYAGATKTSYLLMLLQG